MASLCTVRARSDTTPILHSIPQQILRELLTNYKPTTTSIQNVQVRHRSYLTSCKRGKMIRNSRVTGSISQRQRKSMVPVCQFQPEQTSQTPKQRKLPYRTTAETDHSCRVHHGSVISKVGQRQVEVRIPANQPQVLHRLRTGTTLPLILPRGSLTPGRPPQLTAALCSPRNSSAMQGYHRLPQGFHLAFEFGDDLDEGPNGSRSAPVRWREMLVKQHISGSQPLQLCRAHLHKLSEVLSCLIQLLLRAP